jgi:SAM-dependent methyltransferase
MDPDSPQRHIAEACEQDLARYGDSFRGAGYTRSAEEAEGRYALMIDVVRERRESLSVLDFGCGLGHLLDHIKRRPEHRRLRYTGLDISPRFVEAARMRHPEAQFLQMDVLESDAELPEYDYVILNGIFNYRGEIEQDEMVAYWQRLLTTVYRHCRRGLAFNVMSTLVDWEREDLFHLDFDPMARFLAEHLSRHFVIRHDYPAYEYTTYVYRVPTGS